MSMRDSRGMLILWPSAAAASNRVSISACSNSSAPQLVHLGVSRACCCHMPRVQGITSDHASANSRLLIHYSIPRSCLFGSVYVILWLSAAAASNHVSISACSNSSVSQFVHLWVSRACCCHMSRIQGITSDRASAGSRLLVHYSIPRSCLFGSTSVILWQSAAAANNRVSISVCYNSSASQRVHFGVLASVVVTCHAYRVLRLIAQSRVPGYSFITPFHVHDYLVAFLHERVLTITHSLTTQPILIIIKCRCPNG